jgi:hypothetical protein
MNEEEARNYIAQSVRYGYDRGLKTVEFLMKVLTRLPSDFTPPHVIIIGDGSYHTQVSGLPREAHVVVLQDLSEEVEEVAIGVIAHELAHAHLRHKRGVPEGKDEKQYRSEKERTAYEQARKWGFIKEIDILCREKKWRLEVTHQVE